MPIYSRLSLEGGVVYTPTGQSGDFDVQRHPLSTFGRALIIPFFIAMGTTNSAPQSKEVMIKKWKQSLDSHKLRASNLSVAATETIATLQLIRSRLDFLPSDEEEEEEEEANDTGKDICIDEDDISDMVDEVIGELGSSVTGVCELLFAVPHPEIAKRIDSVNIEHINPEVFRQTRQYLQESRRLVSLLNASIEDMISLVHTIHVTMVHFGIIHRKWNDRLRDNHSMHTIENAWHRAELKLTEEQESWQERLIHADACANRCMQFRQIHDL